MLEIEGRCEAKLVQSLLMCVHENAVHENAMHENAQLMLEDSIMHEVKRLMAYQVCINPHLGAL